MARFPRHLSNAITESAAVHGRSLCNFFCDFHKTDRKKKKKGEKKNKGDIRLSNIFDDVRQLSSVKNELEKAYVGSGDVCPKDAFDKLVLHMTSEREPVANGYDYEREFSAIDPILRRIRDEIVRPLFEKRTALVPDSGGDHFGDHSTKKS